MIDARDKAAMEQVRLMALGLKSELSQEQQQKATQTVSSVVAILDSETDKDVSAIVLLELLSKLPLRLEAL